MHPPSDRTRSKTVYGGVNSFVQKVNGSSNKKKIGRCNRCENCLKLNCKSCPACKNMKKYGGPGTWKLPCSIRPNCTNVFVPTLEKREKIVGVFEKSVKKVGRPKKLVNVNDRNKNPIKVRETNIEEDIIENDEIQKKMWRCNRCENCLKLNCKFCLPCKNMKRNGGPRTWKLPCSMRPNCKNVFVHTLKKREKNVGAFEKKSVKKVGKPKKLVNGNDLNKNPIKVQETNIKEDLIKNDEIQIQKNLSPEELKRREETDLKLKDFDKQVEGRIAEMKANMESTIRSIHTLYEDELISLPSSIKNMKWDDYVSQCREQGCSPTPLTNTMEEIVKAVSCSHSVPLDHIMVTPAPAKGGQTPGLNIAMIATPVSRAVFNETLGSLSGSPVVPLSPGGRAAKAEVENNTRISLGKRQTNGNDAVGLEGLELDEDATQELKRFMFARCFEPTFDPRNIPGNDRVLAPDSDED